MRGKKRPKIAYVLNGRSLCQFSGVPVEEGDRRPEGEAQRLREDEQVPEGRLVGRERHLQSGIQTGLGQEAAVDHREGPQVRGQHHQDEARQQGGAHD